MFQTRGSKVPALKFSLDSRCPAIYVSGVRPPVETVTTDFPMVLRKHPMSAHLLEIRKPLSERVVEVTFRTRLPTKGLERVVLVAELLTHAPNLLLLDGTRRILAAFSSATAERSGGLYEEFRYPPTRKIDLEVALEDQTWLDETAFQQDPKAWLMQTLAGVGPVPADELAYRTAISGGGLAKEIQRVIGQLRQPSRTAWIYSERPLSYLLERNDVEGLRKAIISPIELESLRRTHSFETYSGIVEAARHVLDELESCLLLERAKSPVLKKLRGHARRLREQRRRLVDRKQRFEEALGFQAEAQMLVASGWAMNRCYETVDVTDYFGDRPRKRTLRLDPTRTLRENIDRMFQHYRKAERGLKMVEKELATLLAREGNLAQDAERIRSIGNWDSWNAEFGSHAKPRSGSGHGVARPTTGASAQSSRRRSIQIHGREVLVGRNSQENDELRFRIVADKRNKRGLTHTAALPMSSFRRHVNPRPAASRRAGDSRQEFSGRLQILFEFRPCGGTLVPACPDGGVQNESICQLNTDEAGARGGAREGRPRHSRMLAVRVGGRIATRIFILPPQCAH